MPDQKLFIVKECGDPYSKAWDAQECEHSFDDDIVIFRGDISGMYSKTALIQYLWKTYTGCKIRVEN